MACGDRAPALAPGLGLAPPPHLVHHPAYRVIDWGQALAWLLQGLGARWWPPSHLLPPTHGWSLSARRSGLCSHLPWPSATCSTILPWSCSHRGWQRLHCHLLPTPHHGHPPCSRPPLGGWHTS
uniref:Uncharacterized protein n=1 Tax=Pipistrellus kuhlii TaxID=59472 RepID=A0A7J7ZJ16_PIPKU|nr:hypothetical protein mPipKuh1_009390 [Pipistrellus kuhlii]